MSLDPRVRLVLLGCVGVLAVLFDRPLALVGLVLAALVPLPWLRVDRIWLGRAVGALLAVAWATILSQGLFYSMVGTRTPLVTLFGVTLWREGLLYGAVQALRFVALSVAGLILVASTPPDRLLAGLVRLRVPFGLAFLALTALRFVPVVAEEIATVRRARARRGRPLWRRPPWEWLRLEVSLLRPVVARSLRRSRALAEALDARGFDPLAARTAWRPLKLSALDGAIGALSVGTTVVLTSAKLLFVLYTSDILWIPALRPLYAVVRTWL